MKYLFFIFFSSQVFAYQYYLNKTTHPILTPEMFHRYVRPQIKSMLSEFYKHLGKISPRFEQMVAIMKQANQLEKLSSNWIHICVNYSENCQADLMEMKKDVTIIGQELRKIEEAPSFKRDKFFGLDQMIKIEGQMVELYRVHQILTNTLEEIHLLFGPEMMKRQLPRRDLTELTYQFRLHTDIALSFLLDRGKEEDLDYVWVHFFRKLEREVINKDNYHFLANRLTELNAHWNSFHTTIFNRSFKNNRDWLKAFDYMHSRWNQVLRVILSRI